MYLVVAGNIGAGKSTFVERYAARFGAAPVAEAVVDNPFLAAFYGDRPRWAFHSQVFFLQSRLGGLARIAGDAVQDRSLDEDANVFARNLFLEGSMSDAEWATYRSLFEAVRGMLPKPDRVLYLRARVPTLLARIARRGRAYEKNLPQSYLERLGELYDEWARGYREAPLVTVDTDALDVVNDQAAFERLAALARG
jgi:deoxyadenosine/deoxycytidine kinase